MTRALFGGAPWIRLQKKGATVSDGERRHRGIAAAFRPAARAAGAALAWSEARLDDWGADAPGIALWVCRDAAVAIGLAQDPERETDAGALEQDGVALVRRASGGGAVLLYPGVLCWESWAAADSVRRLLDGGEPDIRRSYEALSRPARSGLERLGVKTVFAGVCDLSVPMPDGTLRKIAGMAQLRRRQRILVHGSILAAADVSILSNYVRFPADVPEYRRGRSHRDFCVTAAEALGWRRSAGSLIESLSGAIVQEALALGWTACTPPEELAPPERRLAEGKYYSDDWNRRRLRPGRTGEAGGTE